MRKLDDLIFDLLPDKEGFITQKQAVRILEEKNIQVSLRTLQLYTSKGILRRGFRQGKEILYPEKSFVQEIIAIHILKTTFGQSITTIQKLANYKKASLFRIVEQLNELLEVVFDEFDDSPRKSGRIFLEIANNRIYQVVIDAYLNHILKGEDLDIANKRKFIQKLIS